MSSSAHVDAATLPPGRRAADRTLELVLGTGFDSLEPAVLCVPDGEHVLVAGPARAGRSTTLARLAASWGDANPGGLVLVVAPRPAPWSPAGVLAPLDAALHLLGTVPAGRPVLLIVDDAERVADPGDRLATLLTERRPGLFVAAAGRPDGLRSLFGHWTAVIRRSRIGVLAAACTDIDGDLLGELLPRRRPLPPRPAWPGSSTAPVVGWRRSGGRVIRVPPSEFGQMPLAVVLRAVVEELLKRGVRGGGRVLAGFLNCLVWRPIP